MFFLKHRREKPVAAAVIDACGDDMLFAGLGDMPVLAHSLDALEQCARIGQIVVLCRERHVAEVFGLAREFGFSRVTGVAAAATWQETMRAGTEACVGAPRFFLFHEADRPLVSNEEIIAAVERASETGGAISAVPARDTLKICDDSGVVLSSPRRDRFFAAQSPQVFDAALYRHALALAFNQNRRFESHMALVENAGGKIAAAAGNAENIKITSPEEFLLAQAILQSREEGVSLWQTIE